MGAMGSIDVTHVAWARAPFSHGPRYVEKERCGTLAYEVVVDHHGRILAVTRKGIVEHTTMGVSYASTKLCSESGQKYNANPSNTTSTTHTGRREDTGTAPHLLWRVSRGVPAW